MKPKYQSLLRQPSCEIEVRIPNELEYFIAETAEELEITPDELVQQAVGFYCRERQGGRHE